MHIPRRHVAHLYKHIRISIGANIACRSNVSDDDYAELPHDELDVVMASRIVGAQGLPTLKPQDVHNILRAARGRCIVKDAHKTRTLVGRDDVGYRFNVVPPLAFDILCSVCGDAELLMRILSQDWVDHWEVWRRVQQHAR